MNDHELNRRRNDLVRMLRDRNGGSHDVVDALENLNADLRAELFGPPGTAAPESIDPTDPRLQVVLDVLGALALIESDDPSYTWERAGVLFAARRHLEAADDYLEAARRFQAGAESGSVVTGDETDWAETAIFHAAKNLALGGHSTAASALLPQLSPEDRAEVEPLLGAGASRGG
jgi:hypothetical protein